jgi:arsenate reductase-like glutaredoxin family protein
LGEGTIVIRAFVYSSCTSCGKTEEALNQSGVDYEVRDFFRSRLTVAELKSILVTAGLSARDVLSTRSCVY